MSSSDSSEYTASERSLVIAVRSTTRNVDEFKPEAQTSDSHFIEYTGPLVRSQLTRKQLQEIRETYRVPSELDCRLPFFGESFGDANEGQVAFYPYLFKLGVRIPLHPFYCSS